MVKISEQLDPDDYENLLSEAREIATHEDTDTEDWEELLDSYNLTRDDLVELLGLIA